ncbi:aspartate-semialdehyde dehydrogenase [Deferribacterales bacterium Es71-Z0220]|jgi:aspartate-semialdehyde dehydrogenase|uniref:aspartate-semialdehyde dehydrogenase n=1 Tax=Deferrivibrio essentukiensis TaxID=2880922 RepID=UPI001F615ECF|nr:aspartate-semialdehyde dehydrogenase [Deferrivibrio essentukiensis]MCB4204928.1 aspartate-semialdehyde dehydrogenase [Deferrivibrio essentukiensis]
MTNFTKKSAYNVAIAGATGAVGETFLQILEERNFPIKNLKLLASARSVGKKLKFKGNEYTVEELTHDSFKDVDIALFSAGGSRSLEFAPSAAKAGALVIDNSSAFRMDRDVPLVVPEVNPQDAFKHNGIIANPNCTTIIMVVALKPLHDYSKIKRVVVSSYQSASGAGAKAMEELMKQTRDWAAGKELKVENFAHQLLFNVIPHIDKFTENGYTKEEMKMFNETRKIMGDDTIKVSATCVRVPVLSAHSEAVTVETEKEISVEKAKELFASAKGLQIIDNPDKNEYPMPLFVAGKDDCYVGRIRKDISAENSLSFWVVGDQLRKGAALNAIQIAELFIK